MKLVGLKTLVALIALHAATSVWALDPVTEAIQRAYAPYRTALFKTNANAPAESVSAIQQGLDAWSAVAAQFGAKPPAPYDADTHFSTTVQQVSTIYRKAHAEASVGQLAQAHETLEEIRDVLAEMRKRNHVTVFSDTMNAYHAQMEQVLKNGPAALATPTPSADIIAQVGVLHYLAQQLETQAPAAWVDDASFRQSLQAVLTSVKGLQQALWSQDTRAAKEALARLKQPYSKLFLHFG